MGKADEWTAIGRRGNKAVAAGYYSTYNATVFVAVDLQTGSIDSSLVIEEADIYTRTVHIKLIPIPEGLLVVASRLNRFIDLLELRNGRLSQAPDAVAKLDVVDIEELDINVLEEHPTQKNSFIVAGCWFMKIVKINLN